MTNSRENLATLPIDAPSQELTRPNSFISTKAMLWHNAIIDDMLANPGAKIKDVAARLGKSPVTIGYIVNSDLFKAQMTLRREQFTKDLDAKLIGKMAQVAELGLDLMLASMEKRRDAIPFPQLSDVTNKSLERLGYGPKPAAASNVQVNVQNNGGAQVVAPVSAEALASARSTLRTIESARLERSSPEPLTIEGSVAEGSGEGSEGAL